MQIRAGERLRLTMSGAGCRAVVRLNTFVVTEPAIEGLAPSEDSFTYHVTSWLRPGQNILTVVLIGSTAGMPFRLVAECAGRSLLMLDEAEFLPTTTPWRLWTTTIEALLDDPAAVTGAG